MGAAAAPNEPAGSALAMPPAASGVFAAASDAPPAASELFPGPPGAPADASSFLSAAAPTQLFSSLSLPTSSTAEASPAASQISATSIHVGTEAFPPQGDADPAVPSRSAPAELDHSEPSDLSDLSGFFRSAPHPDQPPVSQPPQPSSGPSPSATALFSPLVKDAVAVTSWARSGLGKALSMLPSGTSTVTSNVEPQALAPALTPVPPVQASTQPALSELLAVPPGESKAANANEPPTPATLAPTPPSSSLPDALAAAEARAARLEEENKILLARLKQAEDKVLMPPPPPRPPVTAVSATPTAAAAETHDEAGKPRESCPPNPDLDMRLSALSESLWKGVERVTALKAERYELIERATRAEESARAAKEHCDGLARRFSNILGVERPTPVHAGEIAGIRGSGSGVPNTPATAPSAANRSAPPSALATTPAGETLTRQALLERGRRTMEERRRRQAETPGTL